MSKIEANYALMDECIQLVRDGRHIRAHDRPTDELFSLMVCTWFDRYPHGSALFNAYVTVHEMVNRELASRYYLEFNNAQP